MNLTDPIFADADKAREHLEAQRWPEGPVCPHCGVIDQATQLQGRRTVRPLSVQRLPRAVHRDGRNRVRALQDAAQQVAPGCYLMASSKKGISAHQIGHRSA